MKEESEKETSAKVQTRYTSLAKGDTRTQSVWLSFYRNNLSDQIFIGSEVH